MLEAPDAGGTSWRMLPASARQRFGHPPFRISRIRPGLIRGPDADPAFGPLSVIDVARLEAGAIVRMHEHRNDDILSWIDIGRMVHEDTTGRRVELSRTRLMLMNSGRSFDHEETVSGGPVEMLQIFVRPREPDTPPAVQFWDAEPTDGWRLVAAPEGHGAPLTFRQDVTVLDLRAAAGGEIRLPTLDSSRSPWLYVASGSLRSDDLELGTGDAATFSGTGGGRTLLAATGTTLVLFLVDLAAPATRAGTVSGR